MRRLLAAAVLPPLLTQCSYAPFDTNGPPTVTNPAVAACEDAAGDQGLDEVGQQQVMPAGDGRYTVVLIGKGDEGWKKATCTYDPATGAHLQTADQHG